MMKSWGLKSQRNNFLSGCVVAWMQYQWWEWQVRAKQSLSRMCFEDESVKSYFEIRVWMVVASEYTDFEHLLGGLINRLIPTPPRGLEKMSAFELRDVVHEFLQRKKYMVVLDDVRGERDVGLRYAFPRNGNGCIIVTTRVRSIAAACSCVHVHEMKPLSLEKSESLLCEKAFRGEACPHSLSVFFEKILLKCDGLPLAIAVIGSILGGAGGAPLEWLRLSQRFIDETGYPLGSSPHGFSLRRLSKTLSHSYHDLPCYLCFLYLSIVPPKGGGVLDSGETIRLWIAEGLVESKQGRTLEEVARDYLDELSNRSLLQVAEKDVDGSVLSFRIHDLVRDYITTKLIENGMATICHGSGSGIWWPSGHKTRRLAVLKSVSILLSSEMNRLEYLRCMLVWRDVDIGLDLIKALLDKCRLLKVLYLGASPLEGGIPAGVFKLYHLKFLCLRDIKIDHIPKEIKCLENLETLDLGLLRDRAAS